MQWRKPTRIEVTVFTFHSVEPGYMYLMVCRSVNIVHVEKSRCCATCKLSLYIFDIKFYKKFMLFNYLKEMNIVEVKEKRKKFTTKTIICTDC